MARGNLVMWPRSRPGGRRLLDSRRVWDFTTTALKVELCGFIRIQRAVNAGVCAFFIIIISAAIIMPR